MDNEQQDISARPAPRHPLRRPGCVIGLAIWFLVLLTPCCLLYLAMRGEISISTGSLPEQGIRLWLIQEARQSGIGFSNAAVIQNDENMCVQTGVNFILWRGQAEPTRYCTCYVEAESGWQLASSGQGDCSSP